ncbi:MlaA family lipoprotein [Pseudoxanthomonas suwonensis]|uniref:MlaA family lipoprotein n=1 Tax=Pseudoxanthomonas suwonensis TaxID=314722 RepID=UPI00048DF226|nr:VacJ family lipoprotein [Pseudoxanthomonas suwonensis]
MNARALILFPLLLALAACASAPKPAAQAAAPVAVAGEAAGPAPVDAAVPAAPSDEALAAPDPAVAAEPTPGDASADPAAADADAALAPTDEEDDYAALYGEDPASGNGADGASGSVPYDPWEPMNRRIHAFNNVVDRAVARPIARAYVTVVPQPVRLGVTNFFDNLSSPLTMVNQVLQGRPRDAVQTFGRFLVNSTLGIGGIFDPASDLKMKRRSEDFGQTLGIWGWRSSRYVELPFFGPRTLRDVVGLAGDAPLSVVQRIEEDKVRIALQGAQLVDTRAQLLAVDALRDAAPDEYAITRDAWIKRRTFKIESDRRSNRDGNLQDGEDDERHPTVPADAMPLPVTVP